jgi:hypothetical protein
MRRLKTDPVPDAVVRKVSDPPASLRDVFQRRLSLWQRERW